MWPTSFLQVSLLKSLLQHLLLHSVRSWACCQVCSSPMLSRCFHSETLRHEIAAFILKDRKHETIPACQIAIIPSRTLMTHQADCCICDWGPGVRIPRTCMCHNLTVRCVVGRIRWSFSGFCVVCPGIARRCVRWFRTICLGLVASVLIVGVSLVVTT